MTISFALTMGLAWFLLWTLGARSIFSGYVTKVAISGKIDPNRVFQSVKSKIPTSIYILVQLCSSVLLGSGMFLMKNYDASINFLEIVGLASVVIGWGVQMIYNILFFNKWMQKGIEKVGYVKVID